MPPAPGPWDEAQWLQHCAALVQQQDYAQAERGLQAALMCHADSSRLRYNLGVLLQRLGRQPEARTAWLALLARAPDHAKAHARLTELALDELDAPLALHHAQAAVDASPLASPDHALAWCLLGKAQILGGHWTEAQATFQHAVSLDPHAPQVDEGWRLSRVLASAGRWAPEGGVLDAHWMNPQPWDQSAGPPASAQDDAMGLYVALGVQRLKAGDWRHRQGVVAAVGELALRARQMPEASAHRHPAWDALHLDASSEDLQSLARASCRRIRAIHQPSALWTPARRGKAPGSRLKLAYLSYNVGRHPTSYLVHRVLSRHDRDRVEVSLYSLNPPDGSALRSEMEQAVEHHHACHQWPVEAVARRIFDDGIDVLVGLGGHSQGPVVDVAQWRPAPVQVNYLAFCGTVGDAQAFQYHLTDAISVPPQEAPFYDEALVYLQGAHYAYDETRPVAPRIGRAEAGLPPKGLVLCGFNNSYKLTPAAFDAWCELLTQLPDAVLWLYQAHAEQPAHMAREALARGVHPDRLIWARPLPSADHLARFQLADIYLDSFSYNGHTTLLDALYCGVPAVTLKGRTAATRIGAAILGAVGLGDQVATTVADYQARVLALARDPSGRAALQRHLRSLPGRQMPFDSSARARELETAFDHMASRAYRGLGPEPFAVHEL